MMKVADLSSGLTIYVDPLAVQAVAPAVTPPPQGIAMKDYIPRVAGSQLFIAGCAPLVVRGMPEQLAAEVRDAKIEARPPIVLTSN